MAIATETDPRAIAVVEALSSVLDPCSVHNGTRLSFVELGMVEAVRVDDAGHATVKLILDDPVCLYMVDIILGVEAAAREADGVYSASVEIAGDVWSPDRLPARTRERIAEWDRIRAGRHPLPVLGPPMH